MAKNVDSHSSERENISHDPNAQRQKNALEPQGQQSVPVSQKPAQQGKIGSNDLAKQQSAPVLWQPAQQGKVGANDLKGQSQRTIASSSQGEAYSDGLSDLDRIIQEELRSFGLSHVADTELEKAGIRSSERRLEQQQEDARRRSDQERSSRINQIAAEELDKARIEASERTLADRELSDHIDQVVQEELEKAFNDSAKRAIAEKERKQSELEENQKRSDRINQIAQEEFEQAFLDAAKRVEEARQHAADSRQHLEQLENDIYSQVIESVYGKLVDLDAQPATPAENLAYVDENGELVDMTPDRASKIFEEKKNQHASRLNKYLKGNLQDAAKLATAMSFFVPKVEKALDSSIFGTHHSELGRHFSNVDNSAGKHLPSESDFLDSEEIYEREMQAQREADAVEKGKTRNYLTPREMTTTEANDTGRYTTIPREIADIGDKEEREKKINEFLEKQGEDQAFKEFIRIFGRAPYSSGEANVDEVGRARDLRYFEEDNWDDPKYIRRLSAARDMTNMMLLNPYALHIESEYIDIVDDIVDGQHVTYARKNWRSSKVVNAIGTIKSLYNCSTQWALATMILRGGLGIDSHMKLANCDPKDFKLFEDQVVELCRDIYNAQMHPISVQVGVNPDGSPIKKTFEGNPLGPAYGVPGINSVRDDSGYWPVVARTRCYPMGYMPKFLINELRKDWNSPLHQMSERQIQRVVNTQWMQYTYPAIIANSEGDLMSQQRSLENMMRALMSLDGADPNNLNIPEIKVNHNMMVMQAEKYGARDPHIMEANEVRANEMEKARKRIEHTYLRGSKAVRDSDGKIVSAAERRRHQGGDYLRGISGTQKWACSMRLMIWATSPVEAAKAIFEQGIANVITNARLSLIDKSVAEAHKFTKELEDIAGSKECSEAIGVYVSLYRMYGWTAIDAFNSENYPPTKTGLITWMEDYGIIGETIPSKLIDKFKVTPETAKAIAANARAFTDFFDDVLFGSSNLFKGFESKQFVKMSLMEMAELHNQGARETYTSDEVAEWAKSDGGAGMIRSLMMTPAGHEAFMTQGVTSLDRKSPWEHAVRRLLKANGATEFLFRTCISRFAEYGVQRKLNKMPLSNTISYLISRKVIDPIGQKKNSELLKRVSNYQMGSQYDFFAGLKKNMLYDAVMGGSEIAFAYVIKQIIMLALGGIYPPPEKKDKNTASEWILGNNEDALPVKLAWFMDDSMGICYPLGIAMAIAEQGGYTPEAIANASSVFINSVANFSDATDILGAIDLIRNWRTRLDSFLGIGVDPDEYVNWETRILIWFLDLLGDSCPAVIGELIPWSRDFMFSGDELERTSSYIYDPAYDREKAIADNRYMYVDDPNMRALRYEAMNNWLSALILDEMYKNEYPDGRGTSFKYGEMPIDTRGEALYQLEDSPYSLLYFDSSDLPADAEENYSMRQDAAMNVFAYIDGHNYQNSAQAIEDNFILNSDARENAMAYARDMAEQLKREKNSLDYNDYRNVMTWNEFQNNVLASYDTEIDKYWSYYNLLDDIPSRTPIYLRQKSDSEIRYVNDQGEARTFTEALLPTGPLRDIARGSHRAIGGATGLVLNLLGINRDYTPEDYANAMAETVSDDDVSFERYAYGNQPSYSPISSPRTAGKGYNFETIPNWVEFDDEGNRTTDVGSVYDRYGSSEITRGPDTGKNFGEDEWGGQGNNLQDDTDEILNIGHDETPTMGYRNWIIDDRRLPFTDNESSQFFDQYRTLHSGDTSTAVPNGGSNGAGSLPGSSSGDTSDYPDYGYGSNYGYGSPSYYNDWPTYYPSYGYSSGSSYPNYQYTPNIYSNSRQVYGGNPSGMSTRQPYSPNRTYLRPGYTTSGSRKPYSHS